jgi:hypothetical protein
MLPGCVGDVIDIVGELIKQASQTYVLVSRCEDSETTNEVVTMPESVRDLLLRALLHALQFLLEVEIVGPPLRLTHNCTISSKKLQKHTTAGIRWWSPTQLLISRSEAYVWQSGRDAQFSSVYGRMC